MTAPRPMVVRSVRLACGVERAFALFTEEISSWWPPERRHTGDASSRIVLDPAGRFVELSRDGQEVPLGAVRAWEPPARLVLDWFPGTDAAHPTRVVVTFAADGDGTTVEVRHGPTAASAELFDGRAPRYSASWDLVLGALAAAAAAAPPAALDRR